MLNNCKLQTAYRIPHTAYRAPRITIIGPGAMGLLFAGFLKKAGNDVVLLDNDPKRAQKIRKQGVRIEGVSGKHLVYVPITTVKKDIKDSQLVIICVKSYDTEKAVRQLKSAVKKDTLFLTLQNGIGNVEIIQKYINKDNILAGVTSEGATLLAHGHTRHAGRGEIVIGRLDGKTTGRLKEVQKVFQKAGFKTSVAKNVNSFLWSKLIINAGINALTAITRLKNGQLLEQEATRQVMRRAVEEAAAVARKNKIKLIYSDPVKRCEEVARATGANISSMLQDVMKKKKTEIDFINGAIVRRAKQLKINAPVNQALVNFVKIIEKRY